MLEQVWNKTLQGFGPPGVWHPSCVLCSKYTCNSTILIVVHESLVFPEQLSCSSEKSFKSHKFFGFPAFLCIWTLSNNDCMILRSIVLHRGQLRDSFATITEDWNAHWCSRRKNHALGAGRENFWTEWIVYIYLVLPKYICFFYYLVLPFRSYRRLLHVFQKTN